MSSASTLADLGVKLAEAVDTFVERLTNTTAAQLRAMPEGERAAWQERWQLQWFGPPFLVGSEFWVLERGVRRGGLRLKSPPSGFVGFEIERIELP